MLTNQPDLGLDVEDFFELVFIEAHLDGDGKWIRLEHKNSNISLKSGTHRVSVFPTCEYIFVDISVY